MMAMASLMMMMTMMMGSVCRQRETIEHRKKNRSPLSS